MNTISFPMRARRARQAGFTIVELMVGLAIGLFIALGFTASFVNMKTTFRSQDGLAQLQDNERLAMTVLTWSVQEAGYYPTGADLTAVPPVPVLNTDRSEIVASSPGAAAGGNMQQGQYLLGAAAVGTTTSEFLSTAYVSKPGDGILTCQGGVAAPSGGTGDLAVRNVFYVDTASKTLGCVVYRNGTKLADYAPLVTNVTGMTVYYGVDSLKNSDKQNSIDTYMVAADVSTKGLWDYVKSVRITLTFVDPNAAQTGNTAGIQWVQTINLMNNK